MRIQHNIAAMNAYRNYNLNTSAVSKNLEKLSSGYKINRAGDDAAGLAISEKMRAQITGLDAASKNVKDGISLVKTAEGAMQEVQDMLNRMVSLATQSANGTYQDAVDRENLQAEVDQLRSEINRIADSANFNGIKLLDGSLAEKVAATKIDVVGPGLTTTKSEGAKGKYTSGTAITDATYAKKVADGDTFQYTVSLADGTSKTVKLTLEVDDTEKKNYLVAEDGTKYNVSAYTTAAATTVTVTELGDAFVKELNKSAIGKDYNISFAGGKLTLEAKEVGTAASKVTAFDFEHVLGGTRTTTGMSVKVDTVALDEGRELKADDITEYDGTNLDDALFTINGHKFLLLSENLTGKDGTTDPDLYVKAGMEVPSDVTILIGGRGGLKKAAVGTAPGANDAANGNFEQNIKKIAEVTGLNVTDAVNEATATGVAPGAGIRLTLGKGTTGKGLMLQIGDTSDPYNQLKVNIGDIHTKALGLDKISIGTQKGAQDAIDVIKNAINTVSSIRGTLGATQNRLEHTQNNLSVMKENIQDAESTIRDTDVAEEMMAYTKNNILVQSAQAMLAQANQIPQGVLQLLG
ncbi:MAG: flagellin [Oscillospiraceae bacterium]|jgi:flagellin|nr:flagellin [Oscillospiraceae bacterium]